MTPTQFDIEAEKIIHEALLGERMWIHDELSGTSLMKEALDAVDKTEKKALNQLHDLYETELAKALEERSE